MISRAIAPLLLLALNPAAAPGDDTRRAGPAAGAVSIKLGPDESGKITFELVGLDLPRLDRLARAELSADRWAEIFHVSVAEGSEGDGEEPAAMFGAYSVSGGTLRFVPRFPPEPGLTYRAVFDPRRLPDPDETTPGPPIVATFPIRKRPPSPPARVVKIDPQGDRLPENLLKFYIQFSRPMARGDVYRHFLLLGPDGRAIDAPFLELDQELWDPGGTRLTLILDPGRVKRGLAPREQAGPVLEAGKSYTLAVERTLTDADGDPLAAPFRKPFRVGPPDTTPPDPALWALSAPAAGSRDPLVLRFGEPLDRGLLGRVLTLRDDRGRAVEGTEVVEDSAGAWRFLPSSPWPAGAYRIVVDPSLEDLAGNTIGRAFEVDLFEKVETPSQPQEKAVSVPFRVVAPHRP